MPVLPAHHARLRALTFAFATILTSLISLISLISLTGLSACGQGAEASDPADPHAPASAKDIDPALTQRCRRSVEHVATLIRSGPGSASISPQEAAIIDATTAISVASCEREGLSSAQEQCLLAIQSAQELGDAATCPAIAERRPSWLVLPPTAAEQEALLEAYAASIGKELKDGREHAEGSAEGEAIADREGALDTSDHGDHVADGDKDE